MRRPLLLLLVLVVACAATPAAALAFDRYASPSGTGSSPCTTVGDPCPLGTAISSAAQGDVVLLAAGTYSLGNANQFVNTPGLDIRGPAGADKAVISGGLGGLVVQSSGDVVHNLVLTNDGTPLSLGDGTSAYNVVSSSTQAHSPGCEALGTVTIANSVCTDTGTGGYGVLFDPGSTGQFTLFLRGVTAVATGTSSDGLDMLPGGSSTDTAVDARNTILDGHGDDIVLDDSSGGTVAMFASHSNYDSASAPAGTLNTDGTIDPTPPVFVNSASGDYHEAASSPTIDAGDPAFADGTIDADGHPRVQGAGVDIGGYEFTPPPPGVTTGGASAITTGGAALAGTVDPHTAPTTYWFEIGETTAYGIATTSQAAAGAGGVSQAVAGLASGATYHYRLVAQSASGTTFGADRTFTTATPIVPAFSAAGPPRLRVGGFAQATWRAVVAQLSCSVSRCAVTETLTVLARLKPRTHAIVGVVAAARRRIRTRTVVVGAGTFSLPAGENETTIVKLNATGRRLLKRFRRLPVKLTISVAGMSGRPLTAKLTIKRAR